MEAVLHMQSRPPGDRGEVLCSFFAAPRVFKPRALASHPPNPQIAAQEFGVGPQGAIHLQAVERKALVLNLIAASAACRLCAVWVCS